MLDYGYRSKCCKAPIRIGTKKIKKTNQKVKIWICCRCGTRDVNIITKEEALADPKPLTPWTLPEVPKGPIDESEL